MRAADPSLVPELLVADTPRSLAFWCGLCGFGIDYRREEEGFAHISRGTAQVMLEQEGVGRNWITAPETRWYRTGDLEETGVEQFLVTDPDGYLIRFQRGLGRRPVGG